MKWLHYRPFSGKLPTISQHSKEIFLLQSAFAEDRNCGLQGCCVRKKGTVSLRCFFFFFFWVFEILEHPFLSEHSGQSSKYTVDCIRATLWKGKSTIYLTQLKTLSWNLMEFSRVLNCKLYSCLMLKRHSTRINFLKFLEFKLSPQKSLRRIPFLVATCNICKNRLVHRRYPSGYYEKYHFQST